MSVLRRWVLPTSALASGVGVVAAGWFAIRALESQKEERRSSVQEHFPLVGRESTTYERLTLNDVHARYKIKTLDKKHQKEKVLGEGSYAHVIGCTEVSTGKSVALKVVKKAFTKAPDFDREVSALTAARMHPNVVQLLDVIDVPDADSWLLVTELLEGGELFDRILHRGAFSERGAATVIKKVASALSCLHKLGWSHNDVKPENIVYSSKDTSSELKLIDFGMARQHPGSPGYTAEKQLASKDLGTTAYWSPEILDPKTRFSTDSRKIDAWTLGVLTYILLFGCHPFDRSGDASEEVVAQRIGQKSPDGPLPSYLSFDCFGPEFAISENAKRFLTGLMHYDPNKRMSVEDVFEHEWIVETLQSAEAEKHERDVSEEAKATATARRLRGERDAQAALAALLKVATEGSAARDSYYHSIQTDQLHGGEDDPLKDFKFELDKRRLRTYDGIVYDVGEPTGGLYVLVKGRAQLEYPSELGDNNSRTHMAVQLLGPGDLFGETAILEGRNVRNARVRTLNGPIEAYFFSREDVVAVLSGSLELKQRLDELNARRYRLRAANALMTRAKTDENLGKTLHVAKGEKVFSKGEPATHIYLIKSGIVKSIVGEDPPSKARKTEDTLSSPSSSLERALGGSTRNTDGTNRVVLAEWGPGDVFGISALYGSPRFASAVAQTPLEVIEVKREDLERVLEQEPSLRENLAMQFRTFKERSASIARQHTKRKSERARKKQQQSSTSGTEESTVHSAHSPSSSPSASSVPATIPKADDTVVTLRKGDVLFQKGDASDSVFFVQEGVVHLVDAKAKVQYINGAGQTFGNESFIRGTPRRYTAKVASDDVILLKIKVRTTEGNDDDEIMMTGVDD